MVVASEITFLQVNNEDTIHTFFKCVQEIQTKLQYSREHIDKTRLVKFYLKAMGASKIHFLLLQNSIAELNRHTTRYGTNVAHPTMTITSIYDYLIEIEAPEQFYTGSSFTSNSRFKNYMKNKEKYASTTKNIKPNISVLEQLEDILHKQDIQVDDKSSSAECENTLEMIWK